MKNLDQFSVYDIQYLLFSYLIFVMLRCSQLWLDFELIVNFKINIILKFLMLFCISLQPIQIFSNVRIKLLNYDMQLLKQPIFNHLFSHLHHFLIDYLILGEVQCLKINLAIRLWRALHAVKHLNVCRADSKLRINSDEYQLRFLDATISIKVRGLELNMLVLF